MSVGSAMNGVAVTGGMQSSQDRASRATTAKLARPRVPLAFVVGAALAVATAATGVSRRQRPAVRRALRERGLASLRLCPHTGVFVVEMQARHGGGRTS